MTTLSLAMIVKNEAANLPRCLASVRNLVDEMVVVDTGSTDDTVAIAGSFGARVSHFDWIDDFAAARNESLRLCTGNWVLILDGDEAVDALDHATIRAACEKDRSPAFSLTIRNYFLDGNGVMLDQVIRPNDGLYGQGSEYSYYANSSCLRLCRRSPGLAFEGRIHELLDPCFERQRLPILSLDAVIHHFGKVDLTREEEKKVRYLRMALDEAERHPEDKQCQHNLIMQASIANDWSLVIARAKAYLKRSSRPPLPVLTNLALAYQQTGEPAESVSILNRILAADPKHPFALCSLSLAFAAMGRSKEALEAVDRALRHHPTLPTAWLALAEVRKSMGQHPEARTALKQGIEICPKDPALRTKQVQLDLQMGLNEQAVADAWAALLVIPRCGEGQWHALVASDLLKLGHSAEGKMVLDLGLKSFPNHPVLNRLKAMASDG